MLFTQNGVLYQESFKNLHLFYTFYIKMDLDRPFKFVQDLTALLMEKR